MHLILSILLLLFTLFPIIKHQHWFFRIFDFAKVQIVVIQFIFFIISFIIYDYSYAFWIFQCLLILAILFEISILIQYTPLYRNPHIDKRIKSRHSNSFSILSFNVLQFNTQFDRFIKLIHQTKPDLFLTMESNEAWEKAMRVFEEEYPYHHKITLENTYGMHFYSKFEIKKLEENYFVADDVPSIKVKLTTKDGYPFTFYGIHPPPPSPTEEKTSKERDGELLSIAKQIMKEPDATTVVVGDFNNVAWSRSSKLFRRTSGLIDPRIGRGLISTFHANYKFCQFPIDQFYHSVDVFVEELKALSNIGSDHLPFFIRMHIDKHETVQEELVEELKDNDLQEVRKIIQDGKEESSNREIIRTE
jgi:endonuclease/exonuclease/phosphatase (EEP) superfamily protein YafD